MRKHYFILLSICFSIFSISLQATKVELNKAFSVAKVPQEKISNNENILDVSDLKQGLYLLKIQTDAGMITRKVTKQ